MAWSPRELGVVMALPNVFPHPEAFGAGIVLEDDRNAMFFAITADFLDAAVENGCIPPTEIRQITEVDGQLELTIRVAMPVVIEIPAAG